MTHFLKSQKNMLKFFFMIIYFWRSLFTKHHLHFSYLPIIYECMTIAWPNFPSLIRSNSQGVILLRLTTHMLLRLQKLFCLYLSTISFAHKVVVVVKLTLCGHAIHSREVSEKVISTQTFMTTNKRTWDEFIIHCFILYFETVRIGFLVTSVWYSTYDVILHNRMILYQ